MCVVRFLRFLSSVWFLICFFHTRTLKNLETGDDDIFFKPSSQWSSYVEARMRDRVLVPLFICLFLSFIRRDCRWATFIASLFTSSYTFQKDKVRWSHSRATKANFSIIWSKCIPWAEKESVWCLVYGKTEIAKTRAKAPDPSHVKSDASTNTRKARFNITQKQLSTIYR